MTHRTRDALVLSKSPLSMVLCQVRFSKIRSMSSYVPLFQERARVEGYPVDCSAKIKEVVVSPTGTEVTERDHWEFLDRDRTISIVLTEDFLTLSTTRYSTFEVFVCQLRSACKMLADTVQGLLMQRVGLRYVDAIRTKSGESFRNYVKAEFHGIAEPHPFLNPTVRMKHETVGQTDFGLMIVRLSQNHEGKVIPDDVGFPNLKSMIEGVGDSELITLLDLDHFRKEEDELSGERVEEWAWSLHDGLELVFRTVVTESALREWGLE